MQSTESMETLEIKLYHANNFDTSVFAKLKKLETLSMSVVNIKAVTDVLKAPNLKKLFLITADKTPFDEMFKNTIIRTLDMHNKSHKENQVTYSFNEHMANRFEPCGSLKKSLDSRWW